MNKRQLNIYFKKYSNTTDHLNYSFRISDISLCYYDNISELYYDGINNFNDFVYQLLFDYFTAIKVEIPNELEWKIKWLRTSYSMLYYQCCRDNREQYKKTEEEGVFNCKQYFRKKKINKLKTDF